MEDQSHYDVAVVGAGPAGLFAARELAENGVRVVLLNRDIKPGGLAEYGIYPTKLRMKEGLRNQFRQILARKDVTYYGNILVGEAADLRLDELHSLGFHAVLVTVGAQSTKWLGVPGENLSGVYHAKDIVYHYNLLPPFSDGTYQIGKRVAVVGAGNVMMDITHWLVEEKKVDQVITVVRRGPTEVKFDRKELEIVVDYLDYPALQDELERVSGMICSIGQDPEQFRQMIAEVAVKGKPHISDTCLSFRFLSSPVRILGDSSGQVIGLELEDNELEVDEDGNTRARGTGIFETLDVDTVIFAIGDLVDRGIGLPIRGAEFVKNPHPRFPIEGISYEVFDPQSGQPVAGTFLAGWARKPSTGLVGVARKDGVNAARAVLAYLKEQAPSTEPVTAQLAAAINRLGKPAVTGPDLLRLEQLERARAQELNLEFFKFSSNLQMLAALELVK